MFYTIYKTTNNINGKYYIGKHQTKNLEDGYLGSGKLIRRAINKYGLDNFSKEILFVFDSEEEMNAKEKELVTVSEETYNLCDGGQGGFGHINKTRNHFEHNKNISKIRDYSSSQYRKKLSKANKGRGKGISKPFPYNSSGIPHSEETKKRIGLANSKMIGEKNSQYGTRWITNGSNNKKIKKEELPYYESIGYRLGRI